MGAGTEVLSFDLPPARVFAPLADLDSMAKWMPGFVRVERLTEGPLRVGSQYRETRKTMGHQATEHFEVTALDPPRRLALRVDGTKGSSRRGEYLFEYALAPSGGGTDLILTGEIRGLGRFAEFLGRIFAGPMKKVIAKDLDSLKAHLESGAS